MAALTSDYRDGDVWCDTSTDPNAWYDRRNGAWVKSPVQTSTVVAYMFDGQRLKPVTADEFYRPDPAPQPFDWDAHKRVARFEREMANLEAEDPDEAYSRNFWEAQRSGPIACAVSIPTHHETDFHSRIMPYRNRGG